MNRIKTFDSEAEASVLSPRLYMAESECKGASKLNNVIQSSLSSSATAAAAAACCSGGGGVDGGVGRLAQQVSTRKGSTSDGADQAPSVKKGQIARAGGAAGVAKLYTTGVVGKASRQIVADSKGKSHNPSKGDAEKDKEAAGKKAKPVHRLLGSVAMIESVYGVSIGGKSRGGMDSCRGTGGLSQRFGAKKGVNATLGRTAGSGLNGKAGGVGAAGKDATVKKGKEAGGAKL
jgi:hypothetical protein